MSQVNADSPSDASQLNWFRTSVGRITLGPAPDESSITTLQHDTVSHIATIQTTAENADEVRQLAEQANIRWLWIPFENTTQSSERDVAMLQQYIAELRQILTQGGSIYLHCAPGKERCRLLFYALCHHLKMPSANAYSALHSFSAQGANGLSRKELSWAADLGSSVRYQF
ncbi:hypothetical protein [Salinimonas lutimaris]|uniref:hypothetical protein n=1 Tax=Salinimonas lutimaris TaxID=914153 RepID=UPI0010C0C591|nr:hypothetical protein [Salinimonas lutimaris]